MPWMLFLPLLPSPPSPFPLHLPPSHPFPPLPPSPSPNPVSHDPTFPTVPLRSLQAPTPPSSLSSSSNLKLRTPSSCQWPSMTTMTLVSHNVMSYSCGNVSVDVPEQDGWYVWFLRASWCLKISLHCNMLCSSNKWLASPCLFQNLNTLLIPVHLRVSFNSFMWPPFPPSAPSPPTPPDLPPLPPSFTSSLPPSPGKTVTKYYLPETSDPLPPIPTGKPDPTNSTVGTAS